MTGNSTQEPTPIEQARDEDSTSTGEGAASAMARVQRQLERQRAVQDGAVPGTQSDDQGKGGEGTAPPQ